MLLDLLLNSPQCINKERAIYQCLLEDVEEISILSRLFSKSENLM